MEDLLQLLRQGSPDQLESALQAITELVKEDLGQDQLPAIASNLLPTLLDILRNEQVCVYWLQDSYTLALTS